MLKRISESALQTKVLALLAQRGAFGENRSPSFFGSEGVPDVIGVYRGRYFAIELKSPRKRTPLSGDERWAKQRAYLRKVERAGGFALGTNDYSAVIELLTMIDAYIFANRSDGFYREAFL